MRLNLTDLTSLYIQSLNSSDWEEYESSYPAFFRHYHLYWADESDDYALSTADSVARRVELVKSRLPVVEESLSEKGFADEVTVLLFLGKGTSNGHAFWDQERRQFVAWLAVESYSTPMQVDVFALHEILHALHYARSPDFYFRSAEEMRRIGRQVITEGLATFGTMLIGGVGELEALWADYVSPEFARRWYAQCRTREHEMLSKILAEWRTSPEDNPWFTMWDEDDVTRYRGGYYVGLKVMEEIARKRRLGLRDLFALPSVEVERLALETIAEMLG